MTTYPAYMDSATAASYLGMSKQYLEIGRCKGYGPPFVKVTNGPNGAVRYRKSALDQFMAERERQPDAEAEGV